MYRNSFGRTYVAGEKSIYCIKSPAGDGSFKSGALLYRYDADGSNASLILTIDEPMENTLTANNTMNLFGDLLYFSTDKAVYRVKADGTGKAKIADKPASDILIAGGRLFLRFTDDDRLYTLDESGQQVLGIVRQPLIACDNGILYCGEQSKESGKIDLYFFDTATGRSGLLFKGFTAYDSGFAAENDKLVFVDGYYTFCGTVANQSPELQRDFRPGITPGIVSVDMRTGEKQTITKIPEAKDKSLRNLTRFDRFYVYTVEGKPDGNGNTEVSLWAFDTKNGKRSLIASVLNDGPMPLYATPKNLFFGGYRVAFYQGRAGLKKLNSEIFLPDK